MLPPRYARSTVNSLIRGPNNFKFPIFTIFIFPCQIQVGRLENFKRPSKKKVVSDGKFSLDIFQKYIQWKIWWNVKKIGQNQKVPLWLYMYMFFLHCELQLNIVLLKRLEILHCYFWKRRCINSTGRTFHLVSFSRRKGSWFFLLFLTCCDRFLHTYFFFFTPL